MNKKTVMLVFLALLASSSVFFFGYTKTKNPKEVYKVYLDGKTIGSIYSKEELENYINNEQNEIKDKYKVDKVYLPNNLDIEKEITYSNKVSSAEEIYSKIKDIAPFTIKGYEITIKGVKVTNNEEGDYQTKTQKIYTLDRRIFEEALKNTITAFISPEDYEKYINGTQEEIKDVGSIIEKLKIQNEITIKYTNISTEEEIFQDEALLSKYLLFGKLDEQKKYVIKEGDNIADVAFKNRLSTEEFLIANPDITSEDNLLYAGQEVNLGIIDPLFKLEEIDYVVEIQTKEYDTIIEKDPTLSNGVEKIKQKGQNGTVKVRKKLKKVNGETLSMYEAQSEEITPAVNKIVVVGTKVVSGVGNLGIWAWPTAKPYTITSPYGWRWGKLHQGNDIAGPGYNSPIYAANNGKVIEAGYTSINGNYITIDHQNGYYTTYGHMSKLLVKKGQIVEMGQQIGKMGASGFATGVHLHFSAWRGRPYHGGQSFDGRTLYR